MLVALLRFTGSGLICGKILYVSDFVVILAESFHMVGDGRRIESVSELDLLRPGSISGVTGSVDKDLATAARLS